MANSARRCSLGFPLGGYLLFLWFGMFPFVIINALFAELPLFVEHLPEHKQVGSYIGTSFQLANVVPFVYIFVNTFIYKFNDVWLLTILQVLNVLDCIFIVLFWDVTFFGYSVCLYLLDFLCGAIGCTGVVIMFAWASRFKPVFVSAVSTGTALSGVFISVVSLIQGPIDHIFNVRLYFCLVLFMLVTGLASFFVILVLSKRNPDYWTRTESNRDEHASPAETPEVNENDIPSPVQTSDSINTTDEKRYPVRVQHSEEPVSLMSLPPEDPIASEINDSEPDPEKIPILTHQTEQQPAIEVHRWRSRRREWGTAISSLLAIVATSFMTYFIVPGMEPYMMGKDTANRDTILLLISNLFLFVNVFGRFTTMFQFMVKYFSNVWVSNTLQFLCAVWFMLGALLYKTSFFINFSWTFVPAMFIFSFMNGFTSTMSLTVVAHRISDPTFRSKVARWCGICSQIGSLSGTFVTQGLVAIFFKHYNPEEAT